MQTRERETDFEWDCSLHVCMKVTNVYLHNDVIWNDTATVECVVVVVVFLLLPLSSTYIFGACKSSFYGEKAQGTV